MTLRPGSVRTISEALRAASVASATAIPMSAFLRAGASLTPSPVIPQICFLACKRFTISYLCSEMTEMSSPSKIARKTKDPLPIKKQLHNFYEAMHQTSAESAKIN
jgi:hypothetical protein